MLDTLHDPVVQKVNTKNVVNFSPKNCIQSYTAPSAVWNDTLFLLYRSNQFDLIQRPIMHIILINFPLGKGKKKICSESVGSQEIIEATEKVSLIIEFDLARLLSLLRPQKETWL